MSDGHCRRERAAWGFLPVLGVPAGFLGWRATPPPVDDELVPGIVLVREYKGRRIEVKVTDDGYEFDEKRSSASNTAAQTTSGD